MQCDFQKVIWIMSNPENKIMEIEPSGKNNVFNKELVDKSYGFDLFSLYDLVNDKMYSLELNTGEFIIGGIPVEIAKEINGRLISFSNLKIDYRKGLIQYKESFPVTVGCSEKIRPMNFNIGFHFNTDEINFCYNKDGYNAQIVNIKAILSIDSTTLKPRFSITTTEKRTFSNGKETTVRV